MQQKESKEPKQKRRIVPKREKNGVPTKRRRDRNRLGDVVQRRQGKSVSVSIYKRVLYVAGAGVGVGAGAGV